LLISTKRGGVGVGGGGVENLGEVEEEKIPHPRPGY